MAVVTIGKRRVVSVSQTALTRETNIAHIFIEKLETPVDSYPRYAPLQRPYEESIGYYALVACGKKIMVTHNPTTIKSRRKVDPLIPQKWRDCENCADATRQGGIMTITIEPPTIIKIRMPEWGDETVEGETPSFLA